MTYGGAERLLVDSIPYYKKKLNSCDVLVLKISNTEIEKELSESTYVKNLNVKNIYNPFIILKLIKEFKGYDIVHAHLFPTFYWVALSHILLFKNIKIVVTEHSPNNNRRNIFLFKKIEQFIYNRYHKIVCISESVKLELVKYLNNKLQVKLITINNGIDLKKFNNESTLDRADFELSNDDYIIIQVASFRGAKDQDTVIKAMKGLPDRVKLFLVGDGPRLEFCKDLGDSLNVSKRIFFLGNRLDVGCLLRISNCSVVSSNYEGFGLVAVEAMASGLPVIASDISGLNEIVRNYGILFRKSNVEDLICKISSLLSNEEKSLEIAKKCLLRSKDFNIEKMVDGYIEVYKSLLK